MGRIPFLMLLHGDLLKLPISIMNLFEMIIVPQLQIEEESVPIFNAAMYAAMPTSVVALVRKTIVDTLVRKCVEPMVNIMNIPGQFRRTGKAVFIF